MILFFIIYIAYIALFIFCVRGEPLENTIFSIIRDKLQSKELSGKWVVDLISDITFKLIALATLGLFLIPMTKDIPHLINDDIIHMSGVAQDVRMLNSMPSLRQTLVINDLEIDVYFTDRLKEGDSYTVDYLPHSKFAIDIIKND